MLSPSGFEFSFTGCNIIMYQKFVYSTLLQSFFFICENREINFTNTVKPYCIAIEDARSKHGVQKSKHDKCIDKISLSTIAWRCIKSACLCRKYHIIWKSPNLIIANGKWFYHVEPLQVENNYYDIFNVLET